MRAILMICVSVVLAFGEWSSDPASPLELGSGSLPQIAATSTGGLYVAWLTAPDFHIYLQCLDVNGDPQWTPGGVLVSSEPNNSWIAVFHLNLVVDANDNAVITTVDTRTGNWEVYAYKITPDGSLLWGTSGLALSSNGGDNISPRETVIHTDNSIVVTWMLNYSTLKYQRIAADGTLLWGTQGLTISDLGGSFLSPQPVETNDDQVLIQWLRQTGSFPALSSELKVRKYNLAGQPQWAVATLNPASSFPLGNWSQDLLLDGVGGSYSSWTEMTALNQTAKLQHVGANGTVSWGQAVELSGQTDHFRVSPLLAGGASSQSVYAVWGESDANQNNRGITAQRVNLAGQKLWGDQGQAVESLGPEMYSQLNITSMDQDLLVFYIREDQHGGPDIRTARLDTNASLVWPGGHVMITNSGIAKSDLTIDEGPDCIFLSWEEAGTIRAACLRADGSLGSPEVSQPGMIYVPEDVTAIQAAIELASPGDTILVAPGVYAEHLNFLGKDLVLGSQFMTTGDTNFISQTVLDAHAAGSGVVFENGESAAAHLIGLTIQQGTGYYADPDGNGDSSYYGGGIYCDRASPTLSDLKVLDNTVSGGGGGGLFFSQSAAVLEQVLVAGNASDDVGGGLYARANSDLIIRYSSFTGNHCADVGGALYARDSSDIWLDHVRILGNSSAHAGGGIGFKHGCWPLITFTTFANNTIVHYGSAIYLNNSFPIVLNSILWDPQVNEVYFAAFDDSSELTLANCDLQGGSGAITTNDNGLVNWLAGNLDLEPAFNDTADNDFSLTLNSPCVDAGTAQFIWQGDTLIDLDDGAYQGAAPDQGAVEYEPQTLPYFPLNLATQWTYTSAADTFRIALMDSHWVDGHVYYQFDQWSVNEIFGGFRQVGNQILVRGDSTEHLLYNFGTYLGASWVYEDPHNAPETVTLVGLEDTVDTPLGVFANCYQFHRWIGADNEFYEWFAEDIGLVQRDVITFAGLQRYSLSSRGPLVALDDVGSAQPGSFKLLQNHPNPFNPVTTISYDLSEQAQVRLTIYAVTGCEISVLDQGQRSVGNYQVLWDGTTDAGIPVSTGIYFAQLSANGCTRVIKMALIK